MILYNFVKKGPLEYDKFMINLLQYKNEITNISNQVNDDGDIEVIKNTINKSFAKYTDSNSISNKIYMKLVERRCL